jgi:indolepyruvate ferredoxin oxidoreductase alpha subunit
MSAETTALTAVPCRVSGEVALARGVLAAGVKVVTGYPGSPSTGTFDALVALTQPDELDIRWSPNEKVAMEIAFGASLAGKRALVALKSVGMNIALDPLATVSLSGCHAGLVILLGDDPGGWSSQNEQDSRWMARVAMVPIIEPINVRQAAQVMAQAYAWSESIGAPVILRITRAFALAKEPLEEPWVLPPSHKRFAFQRNRWIVLPYLVERRHRNAEERLREFAAALEASPYDLGQGPADTPLGVIAAGYPHAKLLRVLGNQASALRTLGLTSSWPLPEESLTAWLRPLRRVLVLEEGGPFVEELLRGLAQRAGLDVALYGRQTRHIPDEGEVGDAHIAAALQALLPELKLEVQAAPSSPMPSTVPLCPGCPYTPALEALIEVMGRHGGRDKYIVVGETGCMVRANLPPMELFDVKYGLGSGLGLGMGIADADPRHRVVALLGDSSFFHSDINAMPFVAQEGPPMTVILLDNGTTALTGGQTHPGSALDERQMPRERVADLVEVIRGCGIEPCLVDAYDPAALREAIEAAISVHELRVLIVRGPCPIYVKHEE